MKLRIAAIIALLVASLVPAGAGLARTRTTEPTEIIDIRVTLTDTRMKVSRTTVERGVIVRFIATNLGRKRHTFTFADSAASPLTTGPIAPKKRKILLLFADNRGTYPLVGDANKARYRAQFSIL